MAINGALPGCLAGVRVLDLILVESLQGRRIDLWFATFEGSRDERLTAETALICTLNPAWNRTKRPLAIPSAAV